MDINCDQGDFLLIGLINEFLHFIADQLLRPIINHLRELHKMIQYVKIKKDHQKFRKS